jgi:response regulator RpfG family c-di-GMP phosphodiesterase
MLHPRPKAFSDLFLVSLVAGGVAVVLSLALATLTVALRRGPWRETFATGWSLIVWASTVYVPMVAGLGYAYTRASVWALFVALPPLVAAQQLLVLYFQQRDTAERLAQAVEAAEATNRQLEGANEELAAKNQELEDANLSFAASLIVSLDARDHYTAGHSAAVAVYSRDIARAAGLSADEQRFAYLAGLMHDIGKVGLPPGILEKAAALSPEEELMMQQHVVIGERIISPVRQFGRLAPAVRHHHERYDGDGYPDGLVAEAIPRLARIIAVADAYNAMTSDRPYRSALPPSVAIAQLRAVAGLQLDPVFANAFAAALAVADSAYQVARRGEFFIDFERLADAAVLSTALAGV